MLWGNRTQISGSGHHYFPTGPAGLLNHLDGKGVSSVNTLHWKVNDETLIQIGRKCFDTLIDLNIHSPNITNVSPLSSLSKLRRLAITAPCGLSPGCLSSLVPNHSIPSTLIELNLEKCGASLNDFAMSVITKYHGQSITKLNISHTHCGDIGAKAIGQFCHQLLDIDISNSKII
jgi:hypothetical protein